MHTLRKIAAAASLVCLLPAAHADVLTFDDLVGSLNFFTTNYRGFQFGTNNISNTAWFYTTQASPFYTPKSGATYVATDFALYTPGTTQDTQPISNATPFIFSGAWFTGTSTVQYKAFFNNVLLYTSPLSPTLNNVPVFVASGSLLPVTSIVISGQQGFYAMDDFTYNLVPEPGSYALMMAGLFGVAAVVRRRAAARAA